MKNLAAILVIGALATVCICRAQEVSIYAGRGQGQPPPPNSDGEGVQDESELANALGIDRQALYEDLMRISEELGGSPPAEQTSQEDDY